VSDEEKKKEEFDWSNLFAVIPIAIVLFGIGGLLWEKCGTLVHGTTPDQIEALSLDGTPKQVAKGLSSTDVSATTVRAAFKASAKPYESFELTWSSKTATAPDEMRLIPEHAKKEEREEHGTEVRAALAKRLHALHSGSWRWGAVEISSDKYGELTAQVDATPHGKTNPRFARQMDAARQILLEAAFGIPVHASNADLAELLGTGYAMTDIGKIDPRTIIEDAPALIASKFPGSIHDDSTSWQIAVDHPFIEHVSFQWDNERSGRVSSVTLYVNDSYKASRDSFEACLANVLGAPIVNDLDYAAGTKEYIFDLGSLHVTLHRTSIELDRPARTTAYDGAVLSRIFDALGGCRDKAENTGSRGDGRKK
jgi:hypothetical protein